MKRRQRSGIDTINYHTWPETPHERVRKHNETAHKREPRGQSFLSGWQQGCKEQTRQYEPMHEIALSQRVATRLQGTDKTIWVNAWDFQQSGMCDQQSLRSACANFMTIQSALKSDFCTFSRFIWYAWWYLLNISYAEYKRIMIIDEIV